MSKRAGSVALLAAVSLVAGGLVLVASATPAVAAPTNCLRLAQTIPAPTVLSPDPSADPVPAESGSTSIAFDASTNVLFVSTPGDSNRPNAGGVAAVDPSTGATLGTVALPSWAREVAVNAATDRVYAYLNSGTTLVVIDAATYSIAAEISLPAGGLPSGIAIDEADNLIYVVSNSAANGQNGVITEVDGATDTVVTSVTSGQGLGALAVDGGVLYAEPGPQTFNASDLTPISRPVSGSGFGLTADKSAHIIYSGTATGINVLDKPNQTGGFIPLAAPGLGFGDETIAIDPIQHLLFALEGNAFNGSQAQIAVVDLTTDAVIEQAPVPIGAIAVTADPATGNVFVASLRSATIDAFQERPCGAVDTDPPAVRIDAPADGATYPIYSRVLASFSCSDAGSGLSVSTTELSGTVSENDGCIASNDAFGESYRNGDLVDTMTPGTKSFTVTATDNAGLTTTVTHTYTVVGDVDTTPPEVFVTTPTEGATFHDGDVVPADFSCADAGGSGIGQCTDFLSNGLNNGEGFPIDTDASQGEAKTLNVVAIDRAGNQTEVDVDYTVIARPPSLFWNDNGEQFTLGESFPLNYHCRYNTQGGPQPETCVGTQLNGALLDTSTPGVHTFSVVATDSYGNTSTNTATYTVLAGNTSQNVTGGEVVTTDPGEVGPSPTIPVQTQIAVPSGVTGTITVTPQPVGTSPSGFALFGSEIDLSGPEAPSADTPYVATFTIDASALGTTLPADVQVFRNGVLVPDCTDPSAATPDPCVQSRAATPDATGDALITVRTTGFSAWTLGRRTASVAVSGLTPSARARGLAHQTIAVQGSGFVSGSAVSFSGTGVTVNSTSFVDANDLTADVSIASSAAVGVRNVVVTNPDATSATCASCFTLDATPTITALSPNARGQGATNQTVTLTGTNLQAGATVAISGTGVTVNSASGSGASRTLNVSIAASAAVGARSVTVTNPDGGVVTKASAFSVSAKPSVTSVAPASQGRGAAVTATVNGSNFATGASVSFGPNITVSAVTRVSASKLTAHVVIGAAASLGARAATVVNPDGGTGVCAGCFTVTAAPAVVAVSPSSRPRGAAHQAITVAGSGYQAGITAAFSGAGVTVNSVTRKSATSLSLNVSIATTAALGARNLTLTNPDGGTTLCSACFTVNARPTITAITPSSRPHGGTYSIVITGTDFQSGAVVTFSGTGMHVNSTTVTATKLTVSITIASTAPKTSRDVTVTNPDTGDVTKSSGFKVT